VGHPSARNTGATLSLTCIPSMVKIDHFVRDSARFSGCHLDDEATFTRRRPSRKTGEKAGQKKQDRSCIDHLFNFVIPKSPKKKQPERIVQAISRPSRESAEAFIYAWSDTREVREPDSKAYAVLNDTEQQVSPGVIEAFRNYLIKPVLFTHRSEIVDELAA
jgi:hypothetical protein